MGALGIQRAGEFAPAVWRGEVAAALLECRTSVLQLQPDMVQAIVQFFADPDGIEPVVQRLCPIASTCPFQTIGGHAHGAIAGLAGELFDVVPYERSQQHGSGSDDGARTEVETVVDRFGLLLQRFRAKFLRQRGGKKDAIEQRHIEMHFVGFPAQLAAPQRKRQAIGGRAQCRHRQPEDALGDASDRVGERLGLIGQQRAGNQHRPGIDHVGQGLQCPARGRCAIFERIQRLLHLADIAQNRAAQMLRQISRIIAQSSQLLHLLAARGQGVVGWLLRIDATQNSQECRIIRLHLQHGAQVAHRPHLLGCRCDAGLATLECRPGQLGRMRSGAGDPLRTCRQQSAGIYQGRSRGLIAAVLGRRRFRVRSRLLSGRRRGGAVGIVAITAWRPLSQNAGYGHLGWRRRRFYTGRCGRCFGGNLG